MSEEKHGLEDLKEIVSETMISQTIVTQSISQKTAPAPQVVRTPVLDALGRAYATGKRKNAIARVWLKPGSGKIMINGREYTQYFARPVLQMILRHPFKIVNRENQFDAFVTVAGGGLSGQAGAVRHGLSKALTFYEPDLRSPLKHEGLLTRDSRVVERKKYGRKKARRKFQFSKR